MDEAANTCTDTCGQFIYVGQDGVRRCVLKCRDDLVRPDGVQNIDANNQTCMTQQECVDAGSYVD